MRNRSALRDWVEYAAARLILASLEYGPLSLSHLLARGYARLLDVAVPRLRRVAMSNLELAFPKLEPPARARIANGVFHSIARLLVAVGRMPRIDRAAIGHWIRYEGYEHFEAARARGRGVLFATAHLGNWELSAFAHALLTAPMYIVVRPLDNRRIDALIEYRRTLSGNRLIAKTDDARSILKALRENQAVGILIDQNAAPENGVFVDFFGVPACAGTGFAKIAARSGAAVIPGFALWCEAEGRYVLRFLPQVQMTGNPEDDTRHLQRILENVIREYPDHWLWIHRRWKTRPPGERSPYE